jgi:rhodanese-related sulfurtransferase
VVDLDREDASRDWPTARSCSWTCASRTSSAPAASPGSISRPLSTFDPGELPAEPGRRVVFSCAAGVRSVRAIELAQAAGLDVDAHYRGGFKDWALAGEPVETT